MKKSATKILLNAEAFGFGPAAAMASFFPFLRKKFKHIGYIGKNHTLDLHKNLPYDSWHDISKLSIKDEEKNLKKIAANYDIFFTAMDLDAAKWAKEVGLKVFIYDALAWYWPKIPKIIRQCELYIAQDFFGVKERLKKNKDSFSASSFVVPSITPKNKKNSNRKHVLITLGGIQNPLWSMDDVAQYARTFLDLIINSIPKKEKIIITTSQALVEKLGDKRVKSYSRDKMLEILKYSKYAFMTSGLGNIYDAAAFNIPTVWLPPANDSQGQQLRLLKQNKISDLQIDWTDLLPKTSIDYHSNQNLVLKKIKKFMDLSKDVSLLPRFKKIFSNSRRRISSKRTSRISSLLDKFGSDGVKTITDLIFQYSQLNK